MRKWLRQARLISLESRLDQQHGSVFVDPVGDRRISIACNLVPSAINDLSSTGLSATLVAVSLAAKAGVSLRGCYLYTTEPSSSVLEAKVLLTIGVRGIFRHAKKPRVSGVDELLDDAGVSTEYLESDIDNRKASKQC